MPADKPDGYGAGPAFTLVPALAFGRRRYRSVNSVTVGSTVAYSSASGSGLLPSCTKYTSYQVRKVYTVQILRRSFVLPS